MAKIEELLHRRTDLSTFLVHLTRPSDDGESSALDNLKSIIESMTIEARTPLGPAAHLEHVLSAGASQKVICMTETPLEHVWMMLEEIDGRTLRFEPYGLAITKTTGRKAGFNPVWYTDISRLGYDWPITSVNRMIADAVERCTDNDGRVDGVALRQEPVFKVTPFFEQMGPTQGGTRRKEFWWEREWRAIGDHYMSFPSRVVAVLAPEDEHVELENWLADFDDEKSAQRWLRRPILDPRWGLERMISAIARVPDDHVGPFPEYGY